MPRSTKKPLTEPAIRALKPCQKQYPVPDGQVAGLSLRVNADGSKVFTLVYRTPDGRQRRKKLGEYPALKLSKAREMARELRLAVAKGLDPKAEEERARREQAAERAQTFGALAEKYIRRLEQKVEDGERSPSHLREMRGRLRNDILPHVGAMPIGEIQRRDVVALVDGMRDRRVGPSSVKNMLAAASGVFRYALDREIVDSNPTVGVKRPAGRVRDRYLSEDEIRRFWRAVESEQEPVTRAFFKLALLTGQRSGEIKGMRRRDIEGAWWAIPRPKNRKPHGIHLSRPVLAILTELEAVTGNSDWVLESPKKPGQPISETKGGAARIRRRAGLDSANSDRWKPHDLRHTVRTYMAKLGIPPYIGDQVTNHKETSIGQTVYTHYDYAAEKRDALDRWANHLMGEILGDPEYQDLADVVPINGRHARAGT